MKFRICVSEQCGAIIPEEECLDYKHPTGARLCPVCMDSTEEISEEEIKCDVCSELFGEINAKLATVHVPGILTVMDHYCATHFIDLHPSSSRITAEWKKLSKCKNLMGENNVEN